MAKDLPPFGTDGMRGSAEAILGGAEAIGRAGALHFAPEGGTILLASDTRESSPEIVNRLAEGLTEAGADVEILGVMPTPALAYLTRESNAKAGGVTTASHNPYEDNGVKYFDKNGDKLTDKAQDNFSRLLDGAIPIPSRRRGTQRINPNTISQYEDFLVASAEGVSFDGLRMVIDAANGAASESAGRVFPRLGADVVMRANKPNGRNINEDCGATHTGPLQEAVVSGGYGLGVAFDGDHIIYTLAVASQAEKDARKRHKGVVVTHMTNLGTENALRAAGIDVVREDVGDRYVLHGLAETGYKLGGEQSGHIILPELLATGDGMLAAIQTIKAVRASGKSLAEWRDEVRLSGNVRGKEFPQPSGVFFASLAQHPPDGFMHQVVFVTQQ